MRARPSFGPTQDSEDGKAVPQDISRRALTIARLIDRLCKTPGEYTVRLRIPYHGRGDWEVEITRGERLRSMKINR